MSADRIALINGWPLAVVGVLWILYLSCCWSSDMKRLRPRRERAERLKAPTATVTLLGQPFDLGPPDD
jgi:hypothetical protein